MNPNPIPSKKTLVLIDAQNIYYTPKRNWGPGAKVDFLKLYHKVTRGDRAAIANIYLVADPLVDQTRFLQRLIEIGYSPKIKILYPEKGQYRNSNWDDWIIKDGLNLIAQTDQLIMVSGDGDFAGMIRQYKQKGKKTRIVCFQDDYSPLLNCADSVSFLDQSILFKRRQYSAFN
jgi:uncharacterized LabA/DUF88 family protein